MQSVICQMHFKIAQYPALAGEPDSTGNLILIKKAPFVVSHFGENARDPYTAFPAGAVSAAGGGDFGARRTQDVKNSHP